MPSPPQESHKFSWSASAGARWTCSTSSIGSWERACKFGMSVGKAQRIRKIVAGRAESVEHERRVDGEPQGRAQSLQTGRENLRHGDKFGDGTGAIGRGAGRGRRGAGGDPAGRDGGEDREEPGCAGGRGGDPGSFDAMEAPAFSGAAGTEKRGIHPDVEHIGAGGTDGERKPAGDQQ